MNVDGEFDVIYADPPWSYDSGYENHGAVDNHYETMELADIKALEPPAAEDAYLYLWTTAPYAKDAFGVMGAWGFDYKSQAVWDKRKIGIGYWFRGQHELLYVGVKGDVSPPPEHLRRSSVFREERREHSQKPRVVRRYIERVHPDARKLELFARDAMSGWQVWGDETPGSVQQRLEVDPP